MDIQKKVAELKAKYDLNKLEDLRAFIREMDVLEQLRIRQFEESLGIQHH